MGDVYHRDADLVPHAFEVADDHALECGVDGGQRLVEQEQAGRRCQGAGQRHSLAFAPRQRIDAAFEQALEVEEVEELVGVGGAECGWSQVVAVEDVLADVHVWKQRGILEDVSDAALFGGDARSIDRGKDRRSQYGDDAIVWA